MRLFFKLGFSLVETMVVVIIVGMLTGIAVSKLGDVQDRTTINIKKVAAVDLNKALRKAYMTRTLITETEIVAFYAAPDGVEEVIAVSQHPVVTAAYTQNSLEAMREVIRNTRGGTGTFRLEGTTHRDLRVEFLKN